NAVSKSTSETVLRFINVMTTEASTLEKIPGVSASRTPRSLISRLLEGKYFFERKARTSSLPFLISSGICLSEKRFIEGVKIQSLEFGVQGLELFSPVTLKWKKTKVFFVPYTLKCF